MKKKRLHFLCIAGIILSGLTSNATIPTELKDTIKKGSGSIDLLRNVTSPELEAYLKGGTMSLGIDINEASKGAETPTMQGIAIKDLELVLQTARGQMTFDNFYTNTSATILETGSQSTQTFSTAFGRTGSNGITSSGFFNLDDVIYVSGIDLNGASITGAEIRINFVETASNAGFNEEFFDYSAGFEDFAILDDATAQKIEASSNTIAANVNNRRKSMQPSGVTVSGPAATPEPAWYFLLGGPVILAFKHWRKKSEAQAN